MYVDWFSVPPMSPQCCPLLEPDRCSRRSRWQSSWPRAGGVYPGGSSPLPPPSLWLGRWSRPDVTARQVLKYLRGQDRFQHIQQKSQPLWYGSYLLVPHPDPDTQLAPAERPSFSSFLCRLHWFKAVFKSERQPTQKSFSNLRIVPPRRGP